MIKFIWLKLILIFAILSINLSAFGQTKFVKGKIIDEQLDVIPHVQIQNSDSVLLGETDINGNFNIKMPVDSKTLLIGWVGLESISIDLGDSCNQLDIILMDDVIYDYISLKKVDKLRMKRFNKLPELHLKAYQKGIFTTDKACYKQVFSPHFKHERI